MNDEDDLEDRIADLIDELWERYDNEPWLPEMVEQGTAGRFLRKIALKMLDGEHPDVVLFALQEDVGDVGAADAS